MTFDEDKSEYWSETFSNEDFSGIKLASKEFDGCTFNECNFSEAILSRCNFVDCEFNKCNLSMLNVEYSKFSDVVFYESKLIGVNWTTAAWASLAFSSPLKFYKCIINDSSFFGLAFQDLVIEECKAHNVDFREGDFSGANFTYTDFSGCFFNNTNLGRADFSEASNYDIDIYQNTITQAKFSRFEAVRLLDSLDIELID